MTESQRLSVQRAIAADPASIFEVLTTPSGHVAIDASACYVGRRRAARDGRRRSVRRAHGPRIAQGLPARRVHGECRIARYEPDRAIAWTIDGVMQPPIGHVYGYELEPIEGGTNVTSYYDWSDIHEAYREAASSIFPVISETNLRATLGILARVVAPGRGRPGARDILNLGAICSNELCGESRPLSGHNSTQNVAATSLRSPPCPHARQP